MLAGGQAVLTLVAGRLLTLALAVGMVVRLAVGQGALLDGQGAPWLTRYGGRADPLTTMVTDFSVRHFGHSGTT
jgi:hypothetical protein